MDEQRLQKLWQELRSEELLSEQMFKQCSNVLLEWRVKNVRLPKDFEVLLLYKLGQYGMLRCFGKIVQTQDEMDWRIAVDQIVEILNGIQLQRTEDMEDHFDGEFFLRLRLIHDKLHHLLDVSELQNIPVREMVYCLAVFLLIFKSEHKYGVFKLLLLPAKVMKFLRSIVSSAVLIKSSNGEYQPSVCKKTRKLFKMLKKCCKQVEELYILSETYDDIAAICELDTALVSEVMLSQIISKLDKLLLNEVRIMKGLNKLSYELTETYHYVLKNEASDLSLELFYRKMRHNLSLLKALFELEVYLCIIVAYQTYLNRVRECRTFKQMRLLSLYIKNIEQISECHEKLYQSLMKFYHNVSSAQSNATQHSCKMNALSNLKYSLISPSTINLTNIAYFMQTNVNLDNIKNLIQFELSTISGKINSLDVQALWSNIDLEEQYINSTDVPPFSSTDVTDSDESFHPEITSDSDELQLPDSSDIQNDLSSPNLPNLDDIFQMLDRLTTEASQICKDGLFDEPISHIKLILTEQRCSTVEEITQNHQNLPHHAFIQLQYWMTRILEHVSDSKRLTDDTHMLRAGHEMFYGMKFLELLKSNHPSYQVMTTDFHLSVILGALIVTEVSYEEVFGGKQLELDMTKMNDRRKDGLHWMKIQQDANPISKPIDSFDKNSLVMESTSATLNIHQKDLSYLVEKFVNHSNFQSLELLLKHQPQYVPSDTLLIKSIQTGCQALFHLLIDRKSFLGENVIHATIAAHMHQLIMPHLYEYSDETLQRFLTTAIKANNVELIKIVSTQPSIGSTLLTALPTAVQFNKLKIVQIILNQYKCTDLNMLLFSAASRKQWSMFRLLIQHGANPHARVDSPSLYITGFQLAIVGNCSNIVKEWAKNADGNRDLGYLTLAASTGSAKMVRSLLNAGFSVLDECHLYPVAWSNGKDDLKKLLIECLAPNCWRTAVDEMGFWHRLLEQLKLIPYLTYLKGCEELQQESESFQQILSIVRRRLKLYQMINANWCFKSVNIGPVDKIKESTLLESCIKLQSMLSENWVNMNVFKKDIHVYSLTAESYAFVEVVSFQEIHDFELEIFVKEPIITHCVILKLLFHKNRDKMLSSSIRIFNRDFDIQRFECLLMRGYECIVELQSQIQQKCGSVVTGSAQQISQEHRLLLAVRSGDFISTLHLLDQIGTVEQEDLWLDSALIHELIDCFCMSVRKKDYLIQKFHTIGMPFDVRHPCFGQSAVAYALNKEQLELSDLMLSLICEKLSDPQKFRAILQLCSIEVYERFLSKHNYSDEKEFHLVSNALQELTIKHVDISTKLQLYLWFKLAKYGFNNLCTVSDTPKNPKSWIDSIDYVIQNVRKLKYRSDRNDYLGVDNEVLFTFRVIHKHLFFIKDKPHLKYIPLRETTFLLAIFLSAFSDHETSENYSEQFAVFRMVLNKTSFMQILEFIDMKLQQFMDFFLNMFHSLENVISISPERRNENLQMTWENERKRNTSLPSLPKNVWNILVSRRYSNLAPTFVAYTVLSNEPVIFIPEPSKSDNMRRKKLFKLFHRVKQLYSLRKIFTILDQISLNSTSKPVTVACIKRFLQIFGECIKNTPNSQNLPSKLNQVLNQQLSGYINFVKKTRDVTCHDFPLAKKLTSLDDQYVYYNDAGNYLRMVHVTVAILMISTYLEYFRSVFGTFKQCRRLSQMQSLVRFIGNQDAIDSLQEHCMDIIIRYHRNLNEELRTISTKTLEESKTLERLKANHKNRLQVVELLQGMTQRFLYKYRDIQIAAFSTTSVEVVHKFLDVNLVSSNYQSVLELIENTWILLPNNLGMLSESSKLSEQSVSSLTTLQINFDINQETLQMFHCREEVRGIVEEFLEGKEVEVHEKQKLANDLLHRLERGGRGYFNNIFMVDSKIQAIKDVFRNHSIKKFDNKLEALRKRDMEELQMIFETKQQCIKEILETFKCSSIKLLIQNISTIPKAEILAIEYWLLELCEILNSTKQFQDNFFALKYDLQLICGRNFRNYLAHDALSYNLLTCSSHAKVLVNALVMTQKRWKLFEGIKYSFESRIIKTLIDSGRWINQQKALVQSVIDCRFNDAKWSISEGALIAGKFWTVKGIFEGLSLMELNEIIQIAKSNELRTSGANIRKTLTLVDPFVSGKWNTFSDSEWHMEMALHSGDFIRAANNLGNHSWGQWIKSGWFPQSIYPCLGALLSHLNNLNHHEEILDTLMYFGPDFLRAWICATTNNFHDYLIMKVPNALTEVQFNAINLHKSKDSLKNLVPDDEFDSSHLNVAVVSNNVLWFDHLMNNKYSIEDLNKTFELCARYGRLEMLQIMLHTTRVAQNVLDTALNASTQYRKWKAVYLIIKQGVNPWKRLKTNELSAGEIAIKIGNLKLAKCFLKEIPSRYNIHCLLSKAARNGSLKMVKHLTRMGCNHWKDRNYLLNSIKNQKYPSMKMFAESSIIDPTIPAAWYDTVSLHGFDKLHKWLIILHEQKVLKYFTEKSTSNDGGLIALLQTDSHSVKRVLQKMMDFGRLDAEHFLENVYFYDEGTDSEEVLCSLDRDIRSMFSTKVHTRKEFLFQYGGESKNSSFNSVLIDVFNRKFDLPDIIQTKKSFDTNLSPLEFCHDLIQTLDTYTEPSEFLATFNLHSQTFNLIRIGSYFAVAEIRQSKSARFLTILLNTANGKGETVLHHLHSDVDIELLDLFISNGVNLTAVDKKGQTALVHMLTRQISWTIFKYLLDYCVRSDTRDANGVHIFNIRDQDGRTLLYHAVSYGRLRIVEFLLDHGVDPTVRDNSGRFPLYNAVLLRHSSIVYALVKQRPDMINLPYHSSGDTPFSVASTLNNVEFVNFFLDNGADLGMRDDAGFTVVAKTIIKESCNALQLILDYASQQDIDVVNNVTANGWNALQCALMKDNVEVFKTVLEHMVGSTIDSKITDESLTKLKHILLAKNKTIIELNVFEAVMFHNHVKISSFLQECEKLYELKMKETLQKKENNWLFNFLQKEQNNSMK